MSLFGRYGEQCFVLIQTVRLLPSKELLHKISFSPWIHCMLLHTDWLLCALLGCWRRQFSKNITALWTTTHYSTPPTFVLPIQTSSPTRSDENHMGALWQICCHNDICWRWVYLLLSVKIDFFYLTTFLLVIRMDAMFVWARERTTKAEKTLSSLCSQLHPTLRSSSHLISFQRPRLQRILLSGYNWAMCEGGSGLTTFCVTQQTVPQMPRDLPWNTKQYLLQWSRKTLYITHALHTKSTVRPSLLQGWVTLWKTATLSCPMY